MALLLNWFRRLTESGTKRLVSCVGRRGTVYLDIPAEGYGEIRVTVSGVMSHVKARGKEGVKINAGMPARVLRMLDSATVEVEPVDKTKPKEDSAQ